MLDLDAHPIQMEVLAWGKVNHWPWWRFIRADI